MSGKFARIVPAKGPGIPVENTHVISKVSDVIADNRTPMETACVPKQGGLPLSEKSLRLSRQLPGRVTLARKLFEHGHAAEAVCQCSEKSFDVSGRA